jgi:hypothetical protein
MAMLLAGAGMAVAGLETPPKGDPLWKFDNASITHEAASRAEGTSMESGEPARADPFRLVHAS